MLFVCIVFFFHERLVYVKLSRTLQFKTLYTLSNMSEINDHTNNLNNSIYAINLTKAEIFWNLHNNKYLFVVKIQHSDI